MKRDYPTRPIVGVGGVIIWKEKILLEKRKGEPGRGKWSIPGGVVELGENPEYAVIREIREETNLRVSQPRLMDVANSVKVDDTGRVKYHFVIIDYYVKLEGGTLRASDDAQQVRWVDLDQVGNYHVTESFKDFFQKNRQKLSHLDSVNYSALNG